MAGNAVGIVCGIIAGKTISLVTDEWVVKIIVAAIFSNIICHKLFPSAHSYYKMPEHLVYTLMAVAGSLIY